MINPDFLNTFIDLESTRSFTKTAQRRAMTQPGVSQHLKFLEEYFGQVLVRRKGKSFEMTEAGTKVLNYARGLFHQHNELMESIKTDNPKAGLCRMAAPGSFGIKMYSFLLKLAKKNPKLVVHFAYAPNLTAIREVQEGILDVAFVSQKPTTHDLAMEVIDQEQLCIVVPSTFKGNSIADLKKLGFINHPDGFYHGSRLLSENFPEEFRGMDEFPISGHINQITRILEPVALGMGFSALPEYACGAFPQQSRIRVLKLKRKVVDEIWMIHRKHRPLPARFEYIRKEYKRDGK